MKKLPLFLRYLTDQIHERIPSGQVVWYDSVLEGGELKWQNELNERNRQDWGWRGSQCRVGADERYR